MTMLHDYATSGDAALTKSEALRRVQSLAAESGYQNSPRPGEACKPSVPPPLLSEIYERLSHTREGLRAGVNRIHAFNNRVLGAAPESACGTKGCDPSAPCSGDALKDLVHEIAMLTEELLGVASRVERIG